MTRTAIVAGALGVAGRALIEHLEGEAGWRVVGLSRRAPDFATRAEFVPVDLLDPGDCAAKLTRIDEATHVFFAAYQAAPDAAAEVAVNLAMLVNLVETVEAAAAGLAHVQVIHGSKWYGNHLGPYRAPAREDDPRHMPPNFYYDQQDWLEARQRGKRWTWSALRPHGLLGLSIGSPMNQLTALGVFGSMSKHLGLPLRWPGRPGAFDAVYQFTDAGHLARGMAWAATTPACANQAFNFTNGDFVRWRNLWPALARFFGTEPGPVQTLSLERMMADKEPLWQEITARHGLKPYRLAELTAWRFADFVYGTAYDQMSSMTKARRAGWHHDLDSEQALLRLLGRLREERVIP